MKNIVEILKSHFIVLQIVIENFTILDSNLEILIKIKSSDFDEKTILFDKVSSININSDYYFCSSKSSIIIEDLAHAQIEGVKYKIAVAEDSMTFYCENIILAN